MWVVERLQASLVDCQGLGMGLRDNPRQGNFKAVILTLYFVRKNIFPFNNTLGQS
jgi:hypothetical protein